MVAHCFLNADLHGAVILGSKTSLVLRPLLLYFNVMDASYVEKSKSEFSLE